MEKFSNFEYKEDSERIHIEIEGAVFCVNLIEKSIEIIKISEDVFCKILTGKKEHIITTTIKISKRELPPKTNYYNEILICTDNYDNEFNVVLMDFFPNGGGFKTIYSQRQNLETRLRALEEE